MREIKALGGDATDLDLIEDALSGSEREDNDPVEKPVKVVDYASLQKDLESFMVNELQLDPSQSMVLEVDSDVFFIHVARVVG